MPRTKLPSTHDRIKRQLAKKPAGRDRVRQALCDLAGWLAEAPADLWKSFYPASFLAVWGSTGQTLLAAGASEALTDMRQSTESESAARELLLGSVRPRLTADDARYHLLQVGNLKAEVCGHITHFAERLCPQQQQQRRRSTRRKPYPITDKQLEAAQLVGEHKGDVAAAARAVGKSRTMMKKLYDKAMRKLGKHALKHVTEQLPTDPRGQETVTHDERA